MQDKELTCIDCKNLFVFSVRDQEFFEEKGFKQPKRCADCRITKKARYNDHKPRFENHDSYGTQEY